MKNRPLLVFIFILLISASFTDCSDGQIISEYRGPVQQKPETPVNPFEQNLALGRGINLGNALEAPSEGEWGLTIEKNYLRLIREAGFSSIRIPIRWNAHAKESEPYSIDQNFFDRIDQILEWALEYDLHIVLNIHHYNALMENPPQHRDRFLAIWRQIAEHYHNYPQSVLFEVLNEPHGNLNANLWNQYLRDAIEVIRKSNPYRTLVIGTSPWGGIDGLRDLSVPDDDCNIIVTVHYYNPFRFTHQGAGWVDNADDWLGTTWTGTEKQEADVDNDFDMVKEWAEQHDRPIYVGEFGAYSAAPAESRQIWTAYVREAMEERGLSWAYWEFGAGFGIYDRDNSRWRDRLLEALIPDSPEVD